MPRPLLDPLLHTLLSIRNGLDYPLRQMVRFRRSGMQIKGRPHGELFARFPPEARKQAEALASRLIAGYHLDSLAADSTPDNFRENLFYLYMLEQALAHSGASLPAEVQAADIGPSHWFYVQALYAVLRWQRFPQGREVSLTGYEVDAYRVYNSLHSRYDHALAHMRGLPGVTYLPKGFWRQPGQFHLVTMFFPFVFPHDHLAWGLPAGLFDPQALLADAWASLRPGGVLVIVNQGPQEHQAQGESMQSCGIQPRAGYRQDPLLYTYASERYVWVAVHA
jgi:hypothetical protein